MHASLVVFGPHQATGAAERRLALPSQHHDMWCKSCKHVSDQVKRSKTASAIINIIIIIIVILFAYGKVVRTLRCSLSALMRWGQGRCAALPRGLCDRGCETRGFS